MCCERGVRVCVWLCVCAANACPCAVRARCADDAVPDPRFFNSCHTVLDRSPPLTTASLLNSSVPPAAAQVLSRQIPLALGSDVAGGRSFRIPHIASAAYDVALMLENRTKMAAMCVPASVLQCDAAAGAVVCVCACGGGALVGT